VIAVARRYAGGALRVGAVSWAFALPLAAFVEARAAGPASHAFSALTYAIGSVVCHQRPERSFALWGLQLPVCARCTGIYVGAACVAFGYWRRQARPRRLSPMALLLLAATPTLVTLVVEWLTSAAPPNLVRAVAGVPLGIAVQLVLLDELRTEGVR
jgi:uncharacterized membrane protein